jgi:two-component system chemotaxis response regulator CheB
MSTNKINVLVVDDSAFMRLLITDIISVDQRIEVVGTAVDGKNAVESVIKLKPDVLLLDMNMGKYDGLYAVKHVMNSHPIPILILSSIGNTDLTSIFDALNLGAVDYINKPQKGNSKIRNIGDELIQKIINVSTAQPKKLNTAKPKLELKSSSKSTVEIIAIGASTGGPSAIEEVISSLPSTLNVPVLVCQHMPANFIEPFANRLNKLTDLNVVIGKNTMTPMPGMIIIAPGNTNMILKLNKNTNQNQIAFSKDKFDEYNNPSINAMMLSIADLYKNKAIGIILTGMGRDGTKGLLSIKNNGGYTIAQNKASSIIYGMPKFAIQNDAVDKVLDIKEISKHLVSRL